MAKKVDVLAIGAHPDDIELSAGGTVLNCVAQGKKVVIVDLTQGELGSRGTKDTRYIEAGNAAKILGVSNRDNLKLADGFFQQDKESLLKLVASIRKYRPEIVLANAIRDRHPDHGRGSDFISRACFLSGLLKIETMSAGKSQEKWRPKAVYHYIQDRSIKPDFIVDVSSCKDQKFEAILAFETQFYREGIEGPKTPISGKGFLDSLEAKMILWGREIGVRYGEGFTVERTLGVDDLADLI